MLDGTVRWKLFLQSYLCQGYKELSGQSELSTKAECMSVERTLHRKEADYTQRMEDKGGKKLQSVHVKTVKNWIQLKFL